jgi:16S rRNA (cytosine967-C5)-methyltransferase
MKRPSPKRFATKRKPAAGPTAKPTKPSERGPSKGPRPRPSAVEIKPRDDSGRRAGQGYRPRPPRLNEPPPDPANAPEQIQTHVLSLDKLARLTVETALIVEKAVYDDKKHADRTLANILRERRDLGQLDRMLISQAVFALFRWRGWIEPLGLDRPEGRLLYAWLLDAPVVHPVCRHWAQAINRDPSRLVSLGGAPNWTARAEGWKRLHDGIAVTADPWRLFPTWLRDHLPIPPGVGTPKVKNLEFLHALQSRPSLWVRAQGVDPKVVWNELADLGLRPWVHRRVLSAARLGPDANVHHLAPFKQGRLEIQDLASQAVGFACDPDPGERWWDACAGAGGKAIHLAGLLRGKGLVVATDVNESKLKETIRRARRSPFRNLTTKVWDGKHVAGKPGSFDGVLVDAPCSALGTWRRNPDARWTLDKEAIPRLAAVQAQLLRAAAAGVRKGGTLVYSVCTLTPDETHGVIRPFLAERPEFTLDPFPHPLSGADTDGTALLWPQESDNDAMFIARMVRSS